MKNTALLNEAVAYFKGNIGFKRALEKIKQKYRSLGSLGGSITLNKLTEQEKDALGGFLKKDYSKQKSATVKVESFQKALIATRFEELEFIKILERYFNEKLISKQEENILFQDEKKYFFQQLIIENKGSNFSDWLEKAMGTKEWGHHTLSMAYNTDKEKLRQDLILVSKALNFLPCHRNRKERLAFFSSMINKNPHTFDDGTDHQRLLLYALTFLFEKCYPENAEEKAEILYQAGIIKDDISNYTNCFGLLAYTQDKLHLGWQGFYLRKEPMQVTLWNLSGISQAKSPTGKVFVVENPTVFSGIMDEIGDRNIALICTNGQVKLASLILMDKLVESGALLYYSGDFDPEGLTIADRLKERYKEKLILWRYTQEDYRAALSYETISESRLKKMDKIKTHSLRHLGERIGDLKLAGYQELLMKFFIEDLVRDE